MRIVKLPVESRDRIGSAHARRLRRLGRLPVNLYGMGRASASFSVDAHAFGLFFERGSRMFELDAGGKTQVCLLKDVQYNPVGDRILHADFLRVDDTQPVTVNVALEFVGIPEHVSGAVVDYVTRDVHISCIPRHIPAHIEINIADLHVGQTINAEDVPLPEGATLIDPPDTTIVSYHYKHALAVEAEAAVEEAEEGAEPEVLTERKPEGEEGE